MHPYPPNKKHGLSFFFCLISLFLLNACATYSQKIEKAVQAFKEENYLEAENELAEVLSAKRNFLLRHMEFGVLKHEQGDYMESNRLLEEAYQKSEELYGTSISELITRSTTNATFLDYRSEVFERAYIHYYKMLNYIYLAEQSDREEKKQLLDGMRIEGRRVQILLDENIFKQKSYEEAKEDEEKTINKLLNIYRILNGEVINPKELVFRDSAFLHYIMGLMYEKYDEIDNARISYERSAKTYRAGYTRQYNLSPYMEDQAFFDTGRMLKIKKDLRWRNILQSIRDQNLKNSLTNYNPDSSVNLVVIQEVDLSSPKGELNLLMKLNSEKSTIEISPILIGKYEEMVYQLSWFYYLYAPKGIINTITRIYNQDYDFKLVQPKTVNVAPILPALQNIPGLIDALDTGVRLAVPLFYYDEASFSSSLSIKELGKREAMVDADNISALQMGNIMLNAQKELNEAMAVESLRLTACILTGLPPLACSLATSGSSQADTRSWLTLPHSIRIRSLILKPGEYEISLNNQAGSYSWEDSIGSVKLDTKEKIKIIRKRSIDKKP